MAIWTLEHSSVKVVAFYEAGLRGAWAPFTYHLLCASCGQARATAGVGLRHNILLDKKEGSAGMWKVPCGRYTPRELWEPRAWMASPTPSGGWGHAGKYSQGGTSELSWGGCMKRTSGSLLGPRYRIEARTDQPGGGDQVPPVRPLDLANKLGFDPGNSP